MEQRRQINDSPEHLEQNNPIPRAWLVFYIALILWGIYYIWFYTPAISGWSYYKKLQKEMAVQRQVQKMLVARKAQVQTNPYKNNEEAIKEGKAIFQSYCAMCHGEDLKGGVGPDLTVPSLKYGSSDKDLFETVSKGRPGGMPPFGDQLGRDRIWKVVSFVQSMRK